MAKELTELKCRDCVHYKLTGWWDMSRMCELSGFPVDKDGPACISVLPKLSARERRECITK